MEVIELKIEKQKLKVNSPCKLVAGTARLYGVKVTFDDEWDVVPHRLIEFIGCVTKPQPVYDTDEIIELPWECITDPCYLKFALVGMDGNGKIRVQTYSDSGENILRVRPKDWKEGTECDEFLAPTRNLWEIEREKYMGLESMLNGIVDGTVTNVKVNVTNVGSYAFYNNKKIESIDLPLVTNIGDSAFHNCSNLRTINAPSTIDVGWDVFRNCSNLTSIDLPLVVNMGYGCLSYCSNLTSINSPSVINVGSNAFYRCSELTSIDLPLVASIASFICQECSNLTSINLPSAIDMGQNAFRDCPKLSSVNLPLVTNIGDYAFYRCSELTTIDLPSANRIGGGSFSECSNLRAVILRNTKQLCTLSNVAAFANTPIAIPEIEIKNNSVNLTSNSTYALDNSNAITNANVGYNQNQKSLDVTFGGYSSIIFYAPEEEGVVYNQVEVTLSNRNTVSFYLFDERMTTGIGQGAAGELDIGIQSPTETNNQTTYILDAPANANGGLKALKIVRVSPNPTTASITSVRFISKKKNENVGYIYVPEKIKYYYTTATNWTTYASNIRAIEDYPEICGGV